MKRCFLYIVFFSYAATIFKPVVPFIADCLAHTFWHGEHIATVHVEQGKKHVHWQIVNTAKKDQANQHEQSLKKSVSADEHLVPVYSETHPDIKEPGKYFRQLLVTFFSTSPRSIFSPPRPSILI